MCACVYVFVSVLCVFLSFFSSMCMFVMVGMDLRVFCILGKQPITEFHPNLFVGCIDKEILKYIKNNFS